MRPLVHKQARAGIGDIMWLIAAEDLDEDAGEDGVGDGDGDEGGDGAVYVYRARGRIGG